jgi:DNA-binding transcriptional regulator of glucitol operon
MSMITGTNASEFLSGTADADLILGLGGNDLLTGGAGNDTLDGSFQSDTAIYSGVMSGYVLGLDAGNRVTIVDTDPGDGDSGSDVLIDIEAAQFADGTLVIDKSPVLRVNSFTTGAQSGSALSALTNGGFVLTWTSSDQDGSGDGIYAQRFDAMGQPTGPEFQVNTYTTNNQYQSAVTALTDGGFVVTWTSTGQDGSGDGVYAQRYDAYGAAAGSEFRVNTFTNDNQFEPAITTLADGGFVVTWTSLFQVGSYSVYAQRYDASGAVQGDEFQINTYTFGPQKEPAITTLTDASFVVAWTSTFQDGSLDGVYARHYSSSGIALGEALW